MPTTNDAVACPYFSDAARRSIWSHCDRISPTSTVPVSNFPALGNTLVSSLREPSRCRVIPPRSRIRGDSVNPVSANSEKTVRVWPAVSVGCSVIGKSVALPRISSRTYTASRSVTGMTFVP